MRQTESINPAWAAHRIREKQVQQRGLALIAARQGAESASLVESRNLDLVWQEAVFRQNSKINTARTGQSVLIESSQTTIIPAFRRFVAQTRTRLILQFELPYAVIVVISDPDAFMASLLAQRRTRDWTLFCDHPRAVFDIQEREYKVVLFIDIE